MRTGIIFDLDGTLWDSSIPVVESWNHVLRDCEDVDYLITREDMLAEMGKTMDQIMEDLFPAITVTRRQELLKRCCEEEEKWLEKKGAVLFPELEETLKILYRSFDLFIVSNCQSGYIETFLKVNRLGQYIKDVECWGNTEKRKGENIKLVIERNRLEKAVYVGDTNGDKEAAEAAGIPFIYAEYGFGEVENYKYSIQSLNELPERLKDVLIN
ncbi:MAG: HAD family hydrolase [Lachnoclostridium sp.]|jgi:phosphoglycolate phosphatase|nr:HAD family hydrolase [Lachnoclostridium sp.]